MECNPHTGAIGRRQLKLDFAHFCIEEFCASKPHGVTRELQLPKSSRAAILSLLKICSVSSWTESARGCAIFSGCDFTSRANAAATVLPLWRKQIKILFPTKKKFGFIVNFTTIDRASPSREASAPDRDRGEIETRISRSARISEILGKSGRKCALKRTHTLPKCSGKFGTFRLTLFRVRSLIQMTEMFVGVITQNIWVWLNLNFIRTDIFV